MMWPPVYTFVIAQPVAMLDPRKVLSRKARRKNRYGKQDFWSKYRGELSPKQMRESGL